MSRQKKYSRGSHRFHTLTGLGTLGGQPCGGGGEVGIESAIEGEKVENSAAYNHQEQTEEHH